MHKGFLRTAIVLGALAVVLGAFGAHTLKQFLSEKDLSPFETGVRYQFYHVFALLATTILYERMPSRWLRYSGNSFITGIILFSGSLYILTAMKATDTVGLKGIGILTPIGGVFFIIGWVFLFIATLKRN
jgi:uncharacterized membrane protein YgdD (TMEM256/DUF423 family)